MVDGFMLKLHYTYDSMARMTVIENKVMYTVPMEKPGHMEIMISLIIKQQQNYWDILPLCLENIILQERMERYLNEKNDKAYACFFINNNGSNCINEDK